MVVGGGGPKVIIVSVPIPFLDLYKTGYGTGMGLEGTGTGQDLDWDETGWDGELKNCECRQLDISASCSKDAVEGNNHQDNNKEEPMQSILNYMNVQCFVTSDCIIYMEIHLIYNSG